MSAGLERLVPLARPDALDLVRVPRLSVPAQEPRDRRTGWHVEDRADGAAIVRFWHRAPAARAVALAASGWRWPDPPDACDLQPAGGGWWTAAFRVPDDWQSGYEIVEHRGELPPPWHRHGLHGGPRAAREPDDARRVGARGVVRLVEGRAWLDSHAPGADGGVETLTPRAEGEPRVRIRRAADGSRPVPLVVFFDGEAHVDRLATPAVLDAARREGAVPGVALAFVDAGPRRAESLGVPGEQAEWVARALVPRLHDEGVLGPVSRERTVVVGSSFGGLSALFALMQARGAIAAAIAQSVSFWRYDARRLGETVAKAYPEGARLRLHAGRYEGDGPERGAALAARLAEAGHDAGMRVVTGGHDWTWWVPEAIEELGRLLR